MLTLVRRQPQQPRARFAPRSSPRFARRAPASPAQARGSPFADALTACALCFAQVHRPLRRLPRTAGRDAPGTRAGARDGAPAEPARHFVQHCLAQCAPHRRPLNRRGGSDPPASPASIFRSFIQRESPIRPAGPALGSTPDAAACRACHMTLFHAFLRPFGAKQGPVIVGPSVCSGAYGRNLLKSFDKLFVRML